MQTTTLMRKRLFYSPSRQTIRHKLTSSGYHESRKILLENYIFVKFLYQLIRLQNILYATNKKYFRFYFKIATSFYSHENQNRIALIPNKLSQKINGGASRRR